MIIMTSIIANEHKEIDKAISNELFRLASHYKATTSKGMTKGDIMQAMNFTGQEPLQHKQDYLVELENMTEKERKELYQNYYKR